MTFCCDHASFEPGRKGEVYLNGNELKRVDDFKYLGSMMKSSISDFGADVDWLGPHLRAWKDCGKLNT